MRYHVTALEMKYSANSRLVKTLPAKTVEKCACVKSNLFRFRIKRDLQDLASHRQQHRWFYKEFFVTQRHPLSL